VILVIDNYDSFTFNLVQALGSMGAEVRVVRNDERDVDAIARLRPDRIVISPGPCAPDRAGISVEVVRRLGQRIPILGVCLGHQAIAAAYGARIGPSPVPMHGKTSAVYHDGRTIFAGVKNPLTVGRYHSLVVDPLSLPDCLEVTARTEDGVVMGVRHRLFPVEGVQFHPESILTESGDEILRNFLGKGGSR